MKKLIAAMLLCILAFGPIMSTGPAVLAEERSCSGTLGRITVDNLRVPSGRTCTLNGTTVKGNIVVQRSARLYTSAISVNGSIQAEGASYVSIGSRSFINGSVQIDAGGAFVVSGATIGGSLQVVSNSGSSRLSSNAVKGDIQVFSHGRGISITNNRVDGNLQCKGNSPAPTGSGNVVQGNKEDQCRRL
jgi:hypothetical protein